MSRLVLLAMFVLAGCGSPNVSHRQPTDDDVPFGGGFPASHRPGGDPTAAAQRRGEVRVGFPGPGQQPPASRGEAVELDEYVRQQRAR
jgi:hypothetical protein